MQNNFKKKLCHSWINQFKDRTIKAIAVSVGFIAYLPVMLDIIVVSLFQLCCPSLYSTVQSSFCNQMNDPSSPILDFINNEMPLIVIGV